MIKNIKLLQFYFRRGKSRRENIPIDENLKDLTTSQNFQKQIQLHRQRFEARMPQQTLTQTLSQKNPKLGQRFKVDRKQLQKKIRTEIKKQLVMQRIVPAAEGQQFQTLQSKSHIYDQRAQIQFQEKFRNELFKKKQTNRLVEKEKNDYRNYLEKPKNEAFVEYQENLKRFKNSKIDSMMNFRRNNDQLRLLIDSGYIDNPQNLGVILDKMNATPRLENKNQKFGKDGAKENMQSQITVSQIAQSTKVNTGKQLTPQIQQMHNQMIQNIDGPHQMRNPKLLQEFFQTLQQSTLVQKQKAKQDLQLMKSIKKFQSTTFQNRYNTLNFRFKGQVDFDWMKENELLSYIKTQRNIDTQPFGLLTMYVQNKDRQNKFNQPMITPSVMSRIYSVCSLYQFPQTDDNNRVNMMNDKKFVELQRNLFKNIHLLNDESFADAVFAYCRNHKEQQGLLKVKMSEKVIEVMWRELNERVSSLQEEDLGLVLRALSNTSMLRDERFQWGHVVESLSERLPLMSQEYEFESVMSFLTFIPVSQESLTVVNNNILRFRDYKWQTKQTLQSFLQSSSLLMRYKSQFSPAKSTKIIQQLKLMFSNKYQEIMPITEQLSINIMPQLLSVIYFMEKSKQLEAKYEIEVPNKLINKCKKEIVDNIRMQKQPIKKHTIGNVAMSMALVDYCKQLSKKTETTQLQLPVMQVSTLKSLFSFRPLPFNSINYFTYHQMTKLLNSEIPHLPVKAIVQTLFAASLVRYKNEGLVEEVMGKIVEKIHHETKQAGESQELVHFRFTKEYLMLVCCFHHNRMTNAYYYHFVQLLMHAPTTALLKVEPNLIIRFFESIATLSFTTDQQYPQDYIITNHFVKLFDICYKQTIKPCLSLLTKEELLVIDYVANLFEFFKNKTQLASSKHQQYQEITTELNKFNHKMTVQDRYLTSLTEVVKKMNSILSLQGPNQIQLDNTLTKIESQFYQHSIPTIMDQQQQIGSQFKYETVYQNVKKKLIQQNSPNQIQPKTWRIQVPHKKQVYFLTTYEHLFAKYEERNTTVKLFGFWKVYAEIYALKGWNFKIVCTFLEG